MKVKDSDIIKLNHFDDFPDGTLIVAEAEKNIPFEIKRVFYITNFHSPAAIRGKHSHKRSKQIIICLRGSFTLELDDGQKKRTIVMKDNYLGVKINKLIWVTMSKFSKDCLVMVLANDHFDENDYIREYDEFLKCVKGNKSK